MTNKEFFIHKFAEEKPIFLKVLKAIPKDKLDFTPHEKSRTAGRLAYQLASQPAFMSGIVMKGEPAWGDYAKTKGNPSLDEIIALFEKTNAQFEKDMATISDADWETGTAKLTFPGGVWESKKYDMAWGFLFDAIHHRGQLSAYLRLMGAKVPSIYGGSADDHPSV